MKKLFGIAFLLMFSISSQCQELNLFQRKANVIANFHNFPEYERIKMRNYLEYYVENLKNSEESFALGYRFFRDSLNEYYGRWICYEAYLTIHENKETQFVSQKLTNHYWITIGIDTWEYVNNIYLKKVIITTMRQEGSVTFIYRFVEDEK